MPKLLCRASPLFPIIILFPISKPFRAHDRLHDAMAEIKIDSKLFHERLSHFASAWKNDLRSKESLFNGAQSFLVVMGKAEEVPELYKNNAAHVSFGIQLGLRITHH